MSEVSILKLRDGATVVAKVSSEDGEKFLVEHPIELVSAAGMLKQGLGEAISLKPWICLLYTSPSPRDATLSRMPSSA